ncbi:hypothetical protein LCGC14_0311380 [marine sediment metagenome]|uniref:Uncharacterized protein n=1 Tax=marine sediment metagenome TaxID=412755 RepID=A0A0F9TMH1_9ZZZZ
MTKATDKAILDALGAIREGQDVLSERLDTLEGNGSASVAATRTPKRPSGITQVQIPETPELLALKGQCSPSAQRIVERHMRVGVADHTEYVAKLETFTTSAGPSARLKYASLGLRLMVAGKSTPVRKAKATAKSVASPKAGGLGMLQPALDAPTSDWRDFIRATTDTSSIGTSAIAGRAWRARNVANGRDPNAAAS